MTLRPDVEAFFDPDTGTVSYVVIDSATKNCAIIDPVLDYDPASGEISYKSADLIIHYIQDNELGVRWILDTHPHADHLSAMDYLKRYYGSDGAKTGIGAGIVEVQTLWKEKLNLEESFKTDGSQFDHLFEDEETFILGKLECEVITTPGHTPSCCTWRIGDALFIGDTLFMPDGGTARADFPGGDVETLYESIHKILSLPENLRIFVCHDYQPGRRSPQWESTIPKQKTNNIHVGGDKSKTDFIALRTARDATLGVPRLLYPSLQVNIRGGQLNSPEENGTSYMKTPVHSPLA